MKNKRIVKGNSDNKKNAGMFSIIVFSGEFDKVHYALAMASASAAIDKPTTLFFTMEACQALVKSPNPGKYSWEKLSVSNNLRSNGAKMDDFLHEKSLATFEELLTACTVMGVTFMICEMGLKLLDIDPSKLRDDINFKEGGIVSFLNAATKNGTVLFV